MRNALTLVAVFSALALSACASKSRRIRGYQQRIDGVVKRCDNYVKGKKPAYAIRYYNKYIPYYEGYLKKYPELKPSVAKMYAKRATAYGLMRNTRMVQADLDKAKALDATVSVETPAPVQPQPAPQPAAGGDEGQPTPQPIYIDGIPPHQGEPIRIAVLDFEETGTDKKYGVTIATQLAEDLLNRGRFETIEREALQKVIAEQSLSQSELMAKAGQSDSQQILSVRFLVIGTISVEGNAVIANGRIIDWTTGKTLISQTAKKICPDANVSFYFDEIAHDLGVKLEKAYVDKFPEPSE